MESQSKLYDFNIEQQNHLSSIHALTFSARDCPGEKLRSAESELVTLTESFYNSLNSHLKKQLNQDAKIQGFQNFLVF